MDFRGKVLSVKSHWHLQNYHARWKKEGDQHVINVSWHESGKSVTGRWLVVIPLWRPWEGPVLQHHFGDSEPSGRKWQLPLSNLQPGRYMVKAVHAPFGCDNWICDDWIGARAEYEQVIDVYPESWPETFGQHHKEPTVDFYLQSLLAYWYRRSQGGIKGGFRGSDLKSFGTHWHHRDPVWQPPPPPSGLTADEIKRFLDSLRLADMLERIDVPKDGSGSHSIFCANPTVTTEAYLTLPDQALPDICKRVLPNPEVLTLELKEHDSCFIREVAFHYTSNAWEETARKIKLRNKKRKLSEILAKWHKNLSEERPPVAEVIFLSEKFQLFQGQKTVCKGEYEQLKTKYQRQEPV